VSQVTRKKTLLNLKSILVVYYVDCSLSYVAAGLVVTTRNITTDTTCDGDVVTIRYGKNQLPFKQSADVLPFQQYQYEF